MANKEKNAHELLADVISGEDRSNSNTVYNNWAQDYEKDMVAVKYTGPEGLMQHFDKLHVPKDGKILDICAGTGAIGRELVKRGYTDLHAIDGAEKMLAHAKADGNYKSCTALLFEPSSKLPYEDNQFDCALLAGAFAPGHLPLVALNEIVRVVKPGGCIAWICCNPKYYEPKDAQYANGGFYKIVDTLEESGKWKKKQGFPIDVPYIEYSDGFVFAYDVL